MEEKIIEKIVEKKSPVKLIGLILASVILLVSSTVIAVKFEVWDLKSNSQNTDSIPEPIPSGPTIPQEQLIKIPAGECPDAYNGRYFTLNGQAIDSGKEQTDWINANCKDIVRNSSVTYSESGQFASLPSGTCPDGREGKYFTLSGKKLDLYGEQLQWVNDNCNNRQASKEPILLTPFEYDNQIGDVWVFCQTSGNGCPRNELHTGLDYITNTNLAGIRASVDGMVTKLEVYKNSYPDPNNPTYQINMEIQYDSTYNVNYSFEPMTHNIADAQEQLSQMKTKVGLKISQGWRIGNLLMKGANSHVHMDLFKNGVPICPEKYFSETALKTTLSVIHQKYPDRQICY